MHADQYLDFIKFEVDFGVGLDGHVHFVSILQLFHFCCMCF